MKINSFSDRISIRQTNNLGYLFTALGFIFFLMFVITWVQPNIRISWTSNSNMDVLGYNVLRWDSNSNKYVRINTGFIASDKDSLRAARFVYIDQSPPRNSVLNYRIQEIRPDGSMNFSAPIEKSYGDWYQRFLLLGLLAIGLGFLASILFYPGRIRSLWHMYTDLLESQAKL